MNLSCLLKVKSGDTIELAGGKHVVVISPYIQDMAGEYLIITNKGYMYVTSKSLPMFMRIIKK